MSNYPKWWDTTVTIYNQYEDPQTNIVKWYRTVVHDCFWKYTGNKINIGDTILESNSIKCRIRKDPRYLARYEWEQKSETEKANFFTLGVNDIIVQGRCEREINEYEAGKRSSDLIKIYKALQGCMIIEAMSDNSGDPRNNPHYLVTGI